MIKKFAIAVLTAIPAFAIATAARADLITFSSSLTQQNSDLGGGTGNFGTVDISLNNTTGVATFTFTAASGREFVDSNVADLNLATSSFGSVTFVSATPGLTASQSFSSTGSGQVDGFGVFNLTTSIGNASTGQTVLEFSLQSNDFIGATSLSDVLAANGSGFDAAAHERIVGTDTTGFVAETGGSGPTPVPEPASLALLGSALAGFALLERARRKRS